MMNSIKIFSLSNKFSNSKTLKRFQMSSVRLSTKLHAMEIQADYERK
jgi:hypothetical protein